mgnify:CR=1 FL=1
MIRILCPHCHAPLTIHELEQAEMNGRHCLLCPDCASVLVSESAEAECQLQAAANGHMTFIEANPDRRKVLLPGSARPVRHMNTSTFITLDQ